MREEDEIAYERIRECIASMKDKLSDLESGIAAAEDTGTLDVDRVTDAIDGVASDIEDIQIILSDYNGGMEQGDD